MVVDKTAVVGLWKIYFWVEGKLNVSFCLFYVICKGGIVQFQQGYGEGFCVVEGGVFYLFGVEFFWFEDGPVKKAFYVVAVLAVGGNHIADVLHQVYGVYFPRHCKEGKAQFVAVVFYGLGNFVDVFSGIYD